MPEPSREAEEGERLPVNERAARYLRRQLWQEFWQSLADAEERSRARDKRRRVAAVRGREEREGG